MGITFKKIARIISNIIFYFLLAIIVLLVIYIGIINIYKKQGKLSEIPINFYTILTQSMYPNIQAGDIIMSYKTKNDIYEVNDVITFISDSNASKGVTITHRIKEVKMISNKYYYVTKGDANNTNDTSPVPSDNVIGKVVFKIPKAGYIQQFLVSKFGWLVAVVLPCLAIIIYDIVKLVKGMFKKKIVKKALTSENAINSKDDLKDIIEDKYVSEKLQEKIDTVYETNGIEVPSKEVEILDTPVESEPIKQKENDDDVEVL